MPTQSIAPDFEGRNPRAEIDRLERENDNLAEQLMQLLDEQAASADSAGRLDPIEIAAGERDGARERDPFWPPTLGINDPRDEAEMQARREGITYERASLTDPEYNVTLGSSHLADLIDDFGGSYVLAIAAYNAGSHNARSWISEWGDPRSRSVDVVDWIELIPFSETRNYVQRVTENLQVYRYRLAGRPTPIELERDLHRGRH